MFWGLLFQIYSDLKYHYNVFHQHTKTLPFIITKFNRNKEEHSVQYFLGLNRFIFILKLIFTLISIKNHSVLLFVLVK